MKAPLATVARATSFVFFAGQTVFPCFQLSPPAIGNISVVMQVKARTTSSVRLRSATGSKKFRGESSAASWRLVPDSHMQAAFDSLSAKIKSEMMFSSTLGTLESSASNRALIQLGPGVVPLLLKELKESPLDPFPWFDTLTKITGQDPTIDEPRGNWRAMAEAWIAWGQSNGVLARA